MALDLKDIKRIIELMEKHDLAFFNLEKEDFRLKLKKNSGNAEIEKQLQNLEYKQPQANTTNTQDPQSIPASKHTAKIPHLNLQKDESQQNKQEPAISEPNLKEFSSPMVGTFYTAPSPDAEPFVKEGDKVKDGDTLCIIEAMKVMNEIKMEGSGTIEKIYVDDGNPVQYGEALFGIKPS